jgi:hypothetical protein
MENLPKDIRRKLALELKPHDLINFCLLNKKTNADVCDSDEFWRLKLSMDYPLVFNYYQRHNLILKNPKNTYIRKFTDISRELEKFVDEYFPTDKRLHIEELLNLYELYKIWIYTNKNHKNYINARNRFADRYGISNNNRDKIHEVFNSIERKNDFYKR